MRAQPFTAFALLPQDQQLVYESSDRILLPHGYCEALGLKPNDFLQLSNLTNEKLYGTLFGTYTQDLNVIFIPSWMFLKLSNTETLTIALCRKSKCTAIRLRPDSHALQTRSDFVELLNKAIQYHACLTQNTRIPLLIEGIVEFVTIECFLPSNEPCVFVKDCGSVEVQIVDALSVETPLPFLHKSGKKTEHYPFAFLGKAHVLGGEPMAGTPAEVAATACRKRMALR